MMDNEEACKILTSLHDLRTGKIATLLVSQVKIDKALTMAIEILTERSFYDKRIRLERYRKEAREWREKNGR